MYYYIQFKQLWVKITVCDQYNVIDVHLSAVVYHILSRSRSRLVRVLEANYIAGPEKIAFFLSF